jgi:hypothetical protein
MTGNGIQLAGPPYILQYLAATPKSLNETLDLETYNGMHLFGAVALIHGHRHISARGFGRIYSPNIPSSSTLAIDDTESIVQVYFMLKVYVSQRDSSKI